MISAISRRKCRLLYPKLPVAKYRYNKLIYPRIYNQYVLTLPSKSAKGHAKNTGLSLQKLLMGMGIEKIVFMPEINVAWLHRDSDYKPAKEAVEYLIATGMSKTFNGGLLVSVQDIPVFLKHLYWLVRTNIVLAYVYGVDEAQHIVVNICKDGGVHFDTLDEETDKLFHLAFASSGFIFREGNTCFSPWQETSKIKGRTLIL